MLYGLASAMFHVLIICVDHDLSPDTTSCIWKQTTDGLVVDPSLGKQTQTSRLWPTAPSRCLIDTETGRCSQFANSSTL